MDVGLNLIFFKSIFSSLKFRVNVLWQPTDVLLQPTDVYITLNNPAEFRSFIFSSLKDTGDSNNSMSTSNFGATDITNLETVVHQGKTD